jgi:hypothetical protein
MASYYLELPRSAVAISADNGTSQIQADALDFLISAERTDLAESARSYGVFRRSRCATILIFLIIMDRLISIATVLCATGNTPPSRPGSGAFEKSAWRLALLTSAQPHR